MECKKRCGYCCQWLRFQYPNVERFREYLTARGFRIADKGPTLDAYLYNPCQHLRHKGNKATCGIYKKRPKACKDAKCPREGNFNPLSTAS